jgi:hypothetical protein
MRRLTFAFILSAAGGILALPFQAPAQSIRGMGAAHVVNQAALNQAMIRQAMIRQAASPQIVSGGPGVHRWPYPPRPAPGFAVPYGASKSNNGQTASSDIVSGGPGPHRWPYPPRPAPGYAVPYSVMKSGNGEAERFYSSYASQFDATFSPYGSFNLRASANASQK